MPIKESIRAVAHLRTKKEPVVPAPSMLELHPDLAPLKDAGLLPGHMAFILDGNGRWAKERGLPTKEGHRAGADAAKRIMRMCSNLGINVSLWILSPDNIQKRSPEEIHDIYDIFKNNIRELTEEAQKQNGRIIHIGELEGLPGYIRLELRKAQAKTRKNTENIVGLALNYSGKMQNVALAEGGQRARRDTDFRKNGTIESLMFGGGLIKPADIIVRTGKVQRLSGFAEPFLGCETELDFPDVYLPDYNEENLYKTLIRFSKTTRTLGGRPTTEPQTFTLSQNGHTPAQIR